MNKNRMFLHFPKVFLLLSLITSCRSLYDLKTYSKEAASGRINGKEWKYSYAYTDPEAKRPEGVEYMIVLATEKGKHACPDTNDKVADPREGAIAIDGKIGEMKVKARSDRYETEESLFTYQKTERPTSVALFDPARDGTSQYQFAKSGRVKITKITKDYIEGSVIAKINEDDFINGKFKAKICKYGQLN